MKTYLIGYDLKKLGQNYKALDAQLPSFKTKWNDLDSTWIIQSDRSPEQILKDLELSTDGNDKILIVELTSNAAWFGFDSEGSEWLRNNLIRRKGL